MVNKAISGLVNNAKGGLQYIKLTSGKFQLRAYADASFASNDDMTSQLGYLILLCDEDNNCNIIEFVSKKSKRVVRSIMGGELYAFTDAFDAAFILVQDLRRGMNQDIPIFMFTDSKQVFDIMTRGKRPMEKRLAIDVAAACNAYRRFEIERVGLVRGEDNPADALSKIHHNGMLHKLIENNKDETPVQEWIVRTKTSTV